MPKATAMCNSFLNLIYRAVAWANVADNASSSPLTNTYVSMHTSTPTAGSSSQSENETSYTNYARQATARPAGWNAASGGAVTNASAISFPQCGTTGATLTHVATGTDVSGAGNKWHFGALNSNLIVSSGITPQFAAGALTVTET
jgi:hypothetical protein